MGTWETALFDGDLASDLRTQADRCEVPGTIAYPADRQTVGTFVAPGPRERYLHDGSLDEHIAARLLESRLL